MAYPHVGELVRVSRGLYVALTVIFPGLSLMCVCPRFQRRGIGQLLMGGGLARIDSLGLESFIEASDFGKGLYTRCGFRPVKDVSVKMNVAGASEEWEKLSEELLPIEYTATWRPRKGEWKDGEPQITWDKRLKATQD
jgi:GNAT superfamily N-acetyltransferase